MACTADHKSAHRKAGKISEARELQETDRSKVNKTIWAKLSKDVKGRDIIYSKPQEVLATAGRAIAQSMVPLLEAKAQNLQPNVSELKRINTDVLALLDHARADRAMLRRDNVRQLLCEDYVSLCSPQIPITEYNFRNEEDLQQRVNDITALQ